MAAILCKAISDLFSGCGQTFGQILCLPCKACGIACSSVGDLLRTPFMPYLALTFCLNIPGVIYGLKGFALDCPELSYWLIVNAFLCALHMVAGLYIVNRIREATPVDVETPKATTGEEQPSTFYQNFSLPMTNDQGAPNSMSRIKHVLCYDKTMAAYIVVFIIWMVWLSMGVGRRLAAADVEGCDDDIEAMNTVISCGYMYFSLVFVAFGCSLCCLR